MKNRQTTEIPTPEDQGIKLPRLLKFYEHSDFATQQKARFIYYLCLYAISAIIIIIFSTLYIQFNDYEHNGIYLPALLPEIAILVLFLVCLRLLISGFYGLSAHLGIVSGTICVWLTMWLDKANPIARLDTIVIVVALMNLAPLFITRYKSTIIFYISINIGILIAFLYYYHDQMGLSHAVVIDYFIDTSLAMIFTGIVGYSIFNINNRVLNKALAEIKVREQTEKALAISEKKFRELTELLPQTIFESDLNGKINYVNKSGFRMFGYEEEDLKKGVNLTSFINPEYQEIVKRNINHIINRQIIQGTQYEAVKKDGTSIIVQSYTTLIEEDHHPIGLRGIIVDITESKRAEEELKQSVSLMAELLNGIPLPTFMLDANGRFLYLNKAFAMDYGKSVQDLLGKRAYELLPTELAEQRKSFIDKVFMDGKPFFFDDTNQGNFYTNYIYPILDNEGRAKHVVIFALDVTKRKQSEKKLLESEERYRKLIEAIPDIIMLSDLKGNILYGNAPLEIITGIGLKDYNNPERAAHIHPDDIKIVSEAIKDLIKHDKANTEVIENRFIDSWGNMHWFSGRIAKLNINGQVVLQTVSRDITEKKIIERELENHRNNLELLVKERTEELAATNEELTATNEELLNQREELQTALNKLNDAQKQLIQSEKMASLGLLSAGIAHEINNPLNFIHGGILGIEEYIKDNLQEHLDNINPLINAIHVGVKRSSEIVSSLNHYSRQDDMPQGDCDVHAIIDNCLVMLQNQLKNKVEVKKQFTEKQCHTIGNEGKLHQAILNILANAAQAIEDKGTIRIQTEVLKDSIQISIADSGCGISQKNLARIFDPFFTTKAPGKGTGLGLSITYRIIQEHNGTIDYQSQPDKGTTATIKLPVKQA